MMVFATAFRGCPRGSDPGAGCRDQGTNKNHNKKCNYYDPDGNEDLKDAYEKSLLCEACWA